MISLRVGPIVRAIDQYHAMVWAELEGPGVVELRAYTDGHMQTTQTTSVRVGGHYYVLLQLEHLQAGTWYDYQLFDGEDGHELASTRWGQEHGEHGNDMMRLVQCFRTLGTRDETTNRELRLAYGSCRKAQGLATDALHALGVWLAQHVDEREKEWPQLILMIGDQIYADQPAQKLLARYPQLEEGASSFEDFTAFYEYAWTQDAGVRQLLAAVPSFMIIEAFLPCWDD